MHNPNIDHWTTKERKEMNEDPLKRLNKPMTKRLDSLFAVTKEYDEEMFIERNDNPEFIEIEKFLAQ